VGINRRQVFYIPGYEPRGPAFYEKLFRKHMLRFGRLHKLKLNLKSTVIEPLFRRISVDIEGQPDLDLTYDILDNADILSPHSEIPRWKFYWLLLFFTPKIIRSVFRPSCRNVDWAWLVAMAPWLFVYTALICLTLCFIGAYWILSLFGLSPIYSAILALIPVTLIWRIFEKHYRHQNIARIFDSGRFFLDGNDPVQENMRIRLEQFAEIIAEQIRLGQADEYVIVGHSSGSVLAARVVALLLDKQEFQNTPLTMVCMGSVYQLELCTQTHINTRDQVYRKLQNRPHLQWAEVFSSFDAFCPQRMNPCDENLRPKEHSDKPFYRSANFKKNLKPDKFQKLRRNLLWIHMQYILSSDFAETFDYFAMLTAKNPAFQYIKTPGNPLEHD